jgi:hypothetical protein
MVGLVPTIHVLFLGDHLASAEKVVDARDKREHDEEGERAPRNWDVLYPQIIRNPATFPFH